MLAGSDAKAAPNEDEALTTEEFVLAFIPAAAEVMPDASEDEALPIEAIIGADKPSICELSADWELLVAAAN